MIMYIVYLFVPAAFTLAYVILQTVLVMKNLGERKPLGKPARMSRSRSDGSEFVPGRILFRRQSSLVVCA
jgi:hypothetical protein